jgi:hypothetical protein
VAGLWAKSGLSLDNPEFVISLPYDEAITERAARASIDELNRAVLPIKKAKCELYYTINSWDDLDGLLNLQKTDCDSNTIEVTNADCTLPSGLKGWITATAKKNGLLLEVHSQNNREEDVFLREARVLLKDHLPK